MFSDSSSITAPSLLHKHTRSKGSFLRRHYPASSVVGPLRLPDRPPPFLATFGAATPSQSRASLTDPNHLPCMPCSIPRWTGSGARWLTSGAFPRGFLPCPCCLPRYRGGSASTSLLSRPAQASHALRPVELLTHPGQRTTLFYLPCGSLDSLAAVILNMLLECFDGGAPIAPSWSTVPGLRGGHGLGSFNHGPFKHKAFGADTAIVHSLEPPAPFSLDRRTKTILCEQEEHEQDSMLLF